MTLAETSQQHRIPELCTIDAVPLARMIRAREVSATDVMTAFLDHIEAVNPLVNAIVSLRPREDLMAEARAADEAVSRGDTVGPLHGLPQAIKDLAATKGLRTSMGSPLFSDWVPEEDAIFVSRMKAAGAIVIGKTNVPEFGFGSNSYNPIFGLTRNAWDFDRVGGGSSGGAGVSLAMRMLPVADGGDMGGSLRNPGAFNNVIGFRVSQGRVPADGLDSFYGQMAVEGPMGRTVEDVAMLLSVQAGYDARAPLSLSSPQGWLDGLTARAPGGLKFGWLGDFGGHIPFEDGVLSLTRKAAGLFEDAGAVVEDTSPGFDMDALWRCFVVLRSQSIGGRLDQAYRDPARRDLLKPEAVWEIEMSRTLSPVEIYDAGLVRAAWYKALLALFDTYDYLLLPAGQVFPFPADVLWPAEVGGRKMDTYHRWMEVMIGATLAGLPAVSLPAGFDGRGLPMGLQVIGKPRGDRDLLELSMLYETLNPWQKMVPPSLTT